MYSDIVLFFQSINPNHLLGPALGSALYSYGGFPLPFLSVGIFGLLVAIALFFAVPDVQATKRDASDDDSNVLNMRGIAKVIKFPICLS